MPIPSSFALIVVAVLGGLVALSGLAFLIFRTQISNLIGTAYKASARRITVEGKPAPSPTFSPGRRFVTFVGIAGLILGIAILLIGFAMIGYGG